MRLIAGYIASLVLTISLGFYNLDRKTSALQAHAYVPLLGHRNANTIAPDNTSCPLIILIVSMSRLDDMGLFWIVVSLRRKVGEL